MRHKAVSYLANCILLYLVCLAEISLFKSFKSHGSMNFMGFRNIYLRILWLTSCQTFSRAFRLSSIAFQKRQLDNCFPFISEKKFPLFLQYEQRYMKLLIEKRR